MHKIILILSLFIFSCDEEPDCAGVSGGSAKEDDCGVCSGGTTGLIANVSKDCNDVCGGDSWMSDCGCVTADSLGNDCDDCAGTPYGGAVLDNCGTCDSDNNNDCIQDCLGVWGGVATLEECEALGDLNTLQEIINLNDLYPDDAPFYEPTDIGEQEWADGRLTSLNLSSWNLDTLPNNISNFSSLINLNLLPKVEVSIINRFT